MSFPVLPAEEFVEEQMREEMARPVDPIIPRQNLSPWIRWPIRVILLPFLAIDQAMQKVAKFVVRPPYKRVGSCKERGACCYYVLIEKPKGFSGRLHIWWHTQINGFYPRDIPLLEEGKKQFVVMGCRYLKSNGRCNHYRLRPMICRKWPVIEHFGAPQVLKGCGFKAELRKKKSH